MFMVPLHPGGPGAGTKEKERQFFDPEAYKIVRSARRCAGASYSLMFFPDQVLFDQRGAGRSIPWVWLARPYLNPLFQMRDIELQEWIPRREHYLGPRV